MGAACRHAKSEPPGPTAPPGDMEVVLEPVTGDDLAPARVVRSAINGDRLALRPASGEAASSSMSPP